MIINGDNSILSLVKNMNYKNFNWLDEIERLVHIIEDSDCIIIDSYLAPLEVYEKISNITKFSIFIDDNNRIVYPPGLIINSSIHANDLNYPFNKEKEYLLGSEYSTLNKTFWKEKKKKIEKPLKNILITLGGNDLRNLTPKILKLVSSKFPYLSKKVIIGGGFKNLNEIESIRDENTQLIYYPNAEGMKAAMIESDIAISAAGQTSYELASIGVPSILISVADNQIRSAEKFEKLGIDFYAGLWYEKNLFDKITESIVKLSNFNVRKNMINNAKKIIKADGSKRIVEFILNILKEQQLLK